MYKVIVMNQFYRPTIHRLANALMAGFNVRSDNSLVVALGNGTEKNNFEAIVSWVERTIQQRQLAAEEACIHVLIPQFERELQDWEFNRYSN